MPDDMKTALEIIRDHGCESDDVRLGCKKLAAKALEDNRVPQDVVRLVIAARKVAFGNATPETEDMAELDKASEAFADRIPYEPE